MDIHGYTYDKLNFLDKYIRFLIVKYCYVLLNKKKIRKKVIYKQNVIMVLLNVLTGNSLKFCIKQQTFILDTQ